MKTYFQKIQKWKEKFDWKSLSEDNLILIFTVFCLLIWILFSNRHFFTMDVQIKKTLCIIITIAYVWVLLRKLSLGKKISEFYIILGGSLLKVFDILFKAYTHCIHDLGSWHGLATMESAGGHIGYIEYIFKNQALPNFNPAERWSFYNPPLHYILCAVWLKINQFLKLSEEIMLENLQVLTLFYSIMCVCVVAKILKEYDFSERVRKIILIVVSFHPFFIFSSGYLNNDLLPVLFSFIAILGTVRWYKNPKLKHILLIAVSVGFGMMAKVSVGLIAPAIALVFLGKFWTNRKEWKKYFAQFIAFGVICVPLGLWWGIRNLIKYDLPFTFVQALAEGNTQYLTSYPGLDRFRLNSVILMRPFTNFDATTGTGDFNMFLTMFKSSLFCDYSLFAEDKNMYLVCRSFLYFTIFITVIALAVWSISIVRRFRKHQKFTLLDGMHLTGFAVVLASFVNFCYQFPVICSQDFRYIVPCLLFLMLGTAYQGKQGATVIQKNTMLLQKALLILVGVFAALSAWIYCVYYFTVLAV